MVIVGTVAGVRKSSEEQNDGAVLHTSRVVNNGAWQDTAKTDLRHKARTKVTA